jgi:hypothetical protein
VFCSRVFCSRVFALVFLALEKKFYFFFIEQIVILHRFQNSAKNKKPVKIFLFSSLFFPIDQDGKKPEAKLRIVSSNSHHRVNQCRF